MLPRLIRFSSSRAFVGDKLTSLDELKEFFSHNTWKTADLLNSQVDDSLINHKMMNSLLDLTGLKKSLSPVEQDKLINSLKEQLKFVNKLHSIDIPKEEEHTFKLTRLVDDASKEGTLDFDGLMKEINDVKPDYIKGEVENTWNPISLAKEHDEDYYIVKEGLIKKNKV